MRTVPFLTALLALSFAAFADDPLPKQINYAGGHDFTNPKTGRVVKDLPGTVVFVKEKAPPDAAAWKDVEMRPHTHYCPEFCVDVNGGVKGWKHGIDVMGPPVPFRVANRFTWGQVGGAVYAILDDGLTIGFGHLTEISARVYQAAQRNETLPAGTYLGSFTRRIGVNDAPHSHLQAWKNSDEAVKGHMDHLVLRTTWIPRLKAVAAATAPAAPATQQKQSKPAAPHAGAPTFPAEAKLTEKLGFRTAPGLNAPFVIKARNYLEVGTPIRLLDSKPAFGTAGAFCRAEAMNQKGYIRCDKPESFELAATPGQKQSAATPKQDSGPVQQQKRPPGSAAVEIVSLKDGGSTHRVCAVPGSSVKHYFFRGLLHVDSDGAPTSYHPGYRCDPENGVGWQKKAFSCTHLKKEATCARYAPNCAWKGKCTGTIPSGQCVHDPNGDAKALDYLANAGEPGNFYGLAQDPRSSKMNGDEHAPCVQAAGDPAPGYYVAGTSLVGPGKHACDPRKYVDSSTINYVAMPYGAGGIAKGDLVAVANWQTGKVAFAIFADTGGKPNGMGEGSVALAKSLGAPSNPKGSNAPDAHAAYLVFPGSASRIGLQPKITSWPPDQKKIDEEGKKLLDAWGGQAQFRALSEGLPLENPSKPAKAPCGG